jgi:hypothetical protein
MNAKVIGENSVSSFNLDFNRGLSFNCSLTFLRRS